MARPLARRTLIPAALLAIVAGLALAQPGQPGTPRPGAGGGRGPSVPNIPGQPGGQPGGPGGGGQGLIDRLMQMDANGDGKLSRDEVPPQFAERNFDRFDTNHDGFVDRAELESGAANFRGGGQGGEGGGRMPLGRAMETINESLKALNASALNAASQASDLVQIQTLQEGVIAAKAHAANARFPAEVMAHFDSEAEARMEFREHLLETLETAIELEQAIMEGDSAAAHDALAALAKMEEEGHDEFRRD